ncbi:hypothetical protein [Nocardia sp. CS682]|uniref:hypothetical protein n=1 Tax=Nocardia sp. CS682 TaxID=1047172 RepID=UPI001074B620|nr:hypothetical protein [Nocardia sp. CS682]
MDNLRTAMELAPGELGDELRTIANGPPGPDLDALLAIWDGQPLNITGTEHGRALSEFNALICGDPQVHLHICAPMRDTSGHSAITEAEKLFAQYEQTGRLKLLERAADVFATPLCATAQPELRSAAENGLGLTEWARFERFGARDDIDHAIELFRQALDHAPVRHSMLPALSANLAGALLSRWRCAGEPVDLDDGINAGRAALRGTPADHELRGARLNSLAGALLSKAVVTGDASILRESVELLREALAHGERHAALVPGAKSSLADALRLQHIWGDANADVLDEATLLAKQAVAELPHGLRARSHPLWARYNINLALLLLQRFRAGADPTDLTEAATAMRRARIAPRANAHLAERRLVHAEVERARFLHRWGIPDDHLELSRRTDDLPRRGHRELKRFKRLAERAGAAAPAGHVLHSRARAAVAAAYSLRAALTGSAADDSARRWQQIAGDSTVSVPERVAAARQLTVPGATVSAATSRLVHQTFDMAVDLLPQFAARTLPMTDRARLLADFTGLTRDAAACALRIGPPAPEHALRILEHGHGIPHRYSTELAKREPRLAQRFDELSHVLNQPETAGFSAPQLFIRAAPGAPTGEQRRHAAQEWHRLIAEIRRVPGLHSFLKPPDVSELLAAAPQTGPIIVVNVSGLGSDALIIEHAALRSIALPDLSETELTARTDQFRTAVTNSTDPRLSSAEQSAAQQSITETLSWLWTVLSQPILHELGLLSGPPPDQQHLPHLWWIPTGPLNHLPLHEAGHPDAGVGNRAASSYATTVSELIHTPAREHHLGG